MTPFPESDAYWLDARAFLSGHALADTRIIAPPEFVDQLPGVFAYPVAQQLPLDFFDYAIVHKGQCNDIGRERLMFLVRQHVPVFANEVFVIFAREQPGEEYRPDVHYMALLERIPDAAALDAGRPETGRCEHSGSGVVDHEPIVRFLKTRLRPGQTVVAPPDIRWHFATALDEDALLRVSTDAIDCVVVTALSISRFSDAGIAHVVENYHPVHGDSLHVIYSRHAATDAATQDIPLARALADSVARGTTERAFRLYRMILLGQ